MDLWGNKENYIFSYLIITYSEYSPLSLLGENWGGNTLNLFERYGPLQRRLKLIFLENKNQGLHINPLKIN